MAQSDCCLGLDWMIAATLGGPTPTATPALRTTILQMDAPSVSARLRLIIDFELAYPRNFSNRDLRGCIRLRDWQTVWHRRLAMRTAPAKVTALADGQFSARIVDYNLVFS